MTKKKIYTPFQLVSAVFMILALLWLTISLPFVYDNQQQQSERNQIVNQDSSSDNSEETNPFGNTTEEKNPNSNSFSEEFLHDHHVHDHYFPEKTSLPHALYHNQ